MDRELELLRFFTTQSVQNDDFGIAEAEEVELDIGFDSGPDDDELVDDSEDGDSTDPTDEDLDYDEDDDEVDDDDDYDEDEDYDVEEEEDD